MQLKSFKVQGFKNFRQLVALEDLGSVNVIHGPHNVGKSNLLHALGLFFFVVRFESDMGFPMLPFQTIVPLGDDLLAASGFPVADIFDRTTQGHIRIEATIFTTPDELRQVDIDPVVLPLEEVRLTVELRRRESHVEYTMPRFEAKGGKDYVRTTKTVPESAQLALFGRLVAAVLRPNVDADPRFIWIPSVRLPSDNLTLALYDAKESQSSHISCRWDRFEQASTQLKDILGDGTLAPIYDRKAERADIVHRTAHGRVPLHLAGFGVQQLAGLIAGLFASGGKIAAIEDPEVGLGYAAQRRLRDVLFNNVGGSDGLDQLFITSHSNAFECGTHFYFMTQAADGPRIERRPVEAAPAALGHSSDRS